MFWQVSELNNCQHVNAEHAIAHHKVYFRAYRNNHPRPTPPAVVMVRVALEKFFTSDIHDQAPTIDW